MAVASPARVEEVVVGAARLPGFLSVPEAARGLVVFAHGSGSGRFSPRNGHVAAGLQRAGLATLLIDLLTPEEEADRSNVFDIGLLASRLVAAVEWAERDPRTARLPLGLFGASTGAAAALTAAAVLGSRVGAVVSRGGRPDLALEVLPRVTAATLLLVGSLDGAVIGLNELAFEELRAPRDIVIIPGAGHLFEEPGTLDQVVRHAIAWFRTHLHSQGQR